MSLLEFSYRANHSYKDYLAQQYLKENVDIAISKNLREAVGSIDDIVTKNIGALREGFDRNFEVLNLNLQEIHGTLDVLNSNLVVGFQLLFVKVDELNASLAHLGRGIDTLIQIAKTPVQTWAFNQFEIALDMARRRLYPEALEALAFAIDGKDHQTGYKSDFRFHLLRGALLCGREDDPDSEGVLDLTGAEQSFLLAARYARHDHQAEAAQAFVRSGKAAYADGRLSDAGIHYQSALRFEPTNGEANYQMARLGAHSADASGVELHLCQAFAAHWSFAIRAAAEPIFSHDARMEDLVKRCITSVAERIAAKIEATIAGPLSSLEILRTRQYEDYPVSRFPPFAALEKNIAQIRTDLASGQLRPIFELQSQIDAVAKALKEEFRQVVGGYCEALNSNRAGLVAIARERRTSDENNARRNIVLRNLILSAAIFVVAAVVSFWAGGNSLLYFALATGCLMMTFILVGSAISKFEETVAERRRRVIDERLGELYRIR